MNKQSLRPFLPAVILFVLFSGLLIVFRDKISGAGLDADLLVVCNLGLFLISGISFLMGANGLKSKNNTLFFKMVYGSFFIKLVLIAGAAFAYILIMGSEVNRPSVFLSLGFYVVYTVVEVSGLMKLSRKKSDA